MTFFLRNAAGFMVQFFPCMLLIFLPFPEEAYRFRKKWILTGITILAAAFAVLFPAVLYGTAKWDLEWPCRQLFIAAVIFLTLAACIWLVQEDLIKKILIFTVVSFYAASQYWLVNALNGFLSTAFPFLLEMESWSVYSPCGLVMYCATTALLLPLMIIFVVRPLREYIQEVETKKMRQEYFILIASTSIFIVIIMYVDMTYYYLGYQQYQQKLPLFLIILLDQMMIYWFVFRESLRRKRDNEYQRAMEIQQLQYENIVRDMELTRVMRHDIRHHYNTLNEMLDQGMLDEMKDYLSKVIDTTVRRDSEVYCSNMTVNGLLQYYIGMARDEGIRCEVHAQCGEMNIEPADLTVLFGNVMENAINGCRKCPENRWISIKVGTVQKSFAIEISNSCMGVRFSRHIQSADGFVSAEAFLSERDGGGNGLRSMAHTARKYGGSANFRFNAEKKMFTVRIRLNMGTDV